jgi:hypothetical protein
MTSTLEVRNRGETAQRFDQVAEIIAVLSFYPGGITIFGLHFDARALPFPAPYRSDDESGSEEGKYP